MNKLENYRKFSESRNIPVTIILGVGGEPSNPESIYRIPLESVIPIMSGAIPIEKFLFLLGSFDATTFVPKKEPKVKAYTMEEKRKKYSNAYKSWSTADDEQLIVFYKENKSIKELSSIFNRNEGAIRSRIRKLISEQNDPQE
ncbi:MAG: hypothetical protein K5945_08955 [Bacteroidaceae bacterium]|nr:hypothetical protein [Bacteroidaceae bacterium]